MHDRAPRAAQRLERALDQFFAGLGQHRDRDVGGNEPVLDQFAREIEVGLRRGREADLYFLDAHAHEQIEHAALPGRTHRFDQRLIAIAQVDGRPHRRALDAARRPGSLLERRAFEGAVFSGEHRYLPGSRAKNKRPVAVRRASVVRTNGA